MPDTINPGRQWIIDLIREQFAPVPNRYPNPESLWDDGAEAIADEILANLHRLVAESEGLDAKKPPQPEGYGG